MSTSKIPNSGRKTVRGVLGRLGRARGGQVAVIFALLVPVIAMLIAGVVDASYALNARTQLQDSTDEAALAVSIAAGQNPNDTIAELQKIAQDTLAANLPGVTPTITDFHVCDPVQMDCSDGGTQMANGTVKLAASAPATCAMGGFAPGFCGGNSFQTINASTTTNIQFGKTVQINMVMDSSASMIVGATPADVAGITTWVTANWGLVKPGDPAPYSGDNPPCAFACHDVGGATQPSDVAQGLTNAHQAKVSQPGGTDRPATTRFDVMTAAAQDLIAHVQTAATGNSLNRTNTYLFNIMSFDTGLHNWPNSGPHSNLGFTPAKAAVSAVSPGLDTYLDNALTQLVGQVGANGTGGSAASPLKFVILVTDGLQSDRGANWNGCPPPAQRPTDPTWGGQYCGANGYDTALDPSLCQQMKSKGVIVAVLETPYVPLTGQDPHAAPYEMTVRHIIYPGGPNTPSTVSAALTACASEGYYFQAVNSSDIATGFTTLTDQFLERSAAIVK